MTTAVLVWQSERQITRSNTETEETFSFTIPGTSKKDILVKAFLDLGELEVQVKGRAYRYYTRNELTQDSVNATYLDGVLVVTIKKAPPKILDIPIN